jgi:hypothetical protein
VKNTNDADTLRRSGLFLGSEPLPDVRRRSAKSDDDKGDDDGVDTDKVDSDETDKGDGAEDASDSDGKD